MVVPKKNVRHIRFRTSEVDFDKAVAMGYVSSRKDCCLEGLVDVVDTAVGVGPGSRRSSDLPVCGNKVSRMEGSRDHERHRCDANCSEGNVGFWQDKKKRKRRYLQILCLRRTIITRWIVLLRLLLLRLLRWLWWLRWLWRGISAILRRNRVRRIV
jgi:hypothetical protein